MVQPDVTIEDMSSWLTDETLDWVAKHIGIYQTEALKKVRFALVHRYVSGSSLVGSDEDQESDKLVRILIELLHIIRPMRQNTSIVRAESSENGTRRVIHFETPHEIEVPEVQKLYHVRDKDLILLRSLAPVFTGAMSGNAEKFRSAVFYHSVGRAVGHGNATYLLWCSSIEALFTSHNRDHQGKLVATERIKWFLGATTPIYEPGDIPSFVSPQPSINVGDVVDKLYDVRNYIAYGDVIPKEFFENGMRQGVAGDVATIEVLSEAASFIVRESLLRILKNNLLIHFESATSAEAYFAEPGLTKSLLSKIHKR